MYLYLFGNARHTLDYSVGGIQWNLEARFLISRSTLLSRNKIGRHFIYIKRHIILLYSLFTYNLSKYIEDT